MKGLPLKRITAHRCFKYTKIDQQQVDIISIECNVSTEQVKEAAKIKGINIVYNKPLYSIAPKQYFCYEDYHANESDLSKLVRQSLNRF